MLSLSESAFSRCWPWSRRWQTTPTRPPWVKVNEDGHPGAACRTLFCKCGHPLLSHSNISLRVNKIFLAKVQRLGHHFTNLGKLYSIVLHYSCFCGTYWFSFLYFLKENFFFFSGRNGKRRKQRAGLDVEEYLLKEETGVEVFLHFLTLIFPLSS